MTEWTPTVHLRWRWSGWAKKTLEQKWERGGEEQWREIKEETEHVNRRRKVRRREAKIRPAPA